MKLRLITIFSFILALMLSCCRNDVRSLIIPEKIELKNKTRQELFNKEVTLVLVNGNCGYCVEHIPYYDNIAKNCNDEIIILIYSENDFPYLDKEGIINSVRNVTIVYDGNDSFRILNRLPNGVKDYCLLINNSKIIEEGEPEELIDCLIE